MEPGNYYSLIGIVSWGINCADPDFPGVYSRVTEAKAFIQDNMEGSTCPPPNATNAKTTTKQKTTTTTKTTTKQTTTTTTKTKTEQTTTTTTKSVKPTTTTITTTTMSESNTTTTTSEAYDCKCGVANRETRIVGGVQTEMNEYPWQVGLVSPTGSRPYCGGSILSSKTILTAAHCTDGVNAGSIVVVVGEHDWTINDGQQRFSVCAKVQHPNWDDWTFEFDFSILTLCNDITFRKEASPVCLPTQAGSWYDNVVSTVSGWGTLKYQGIQPNHLMEVNVLTMTNTNCNINHGGEIFASMICASDTGKDACQGDSGGPLVTMEPGNYYSLIGIVSWGINCADPDFPGVYSRVTEAKAFLQDNMKGSTCPPPNVPNANTTTKQKTTTTAKTTTKQTTTTQQKQK
eukprot:GFUD01025728.1.p1 GENE.GFUD01025728.1~~GFUD01025728.1.p1  ORF type:complete len:467 (-),score=127.36 GFUD01025728.1:886-2091(-)